MSARRRLGGRLLEGGLWAAAVLAGGYLLLPSAVDLIRVRREEAREEAVADRAEHQLRDTQREAHWLAHDPQALRKLLERQEVGGRTQEGPDPEAEEDPGSREASPAQGP